MRIIKIRTLAGPNIYTYHPALQMKLDLEQLGDQESLEYPNFNSSLLNLLPGLATHYCSKGKEGGFVERLLEGTRFGHIVEHVALELCQLAGIPVNHGKTRTAGKPGLYHVVIEYQAEAGAQFLLETAVELVDHVLQEIPFPLAEKLAEAMRIIAETEPGPSTKAILQAAVERGIPTHRIGSGSLVQLGYGVHRRFIQAATTSQTSAIGVDISCDKELTKQLLSEAGIPVPWGQVVKSEDEAVAAFREIGAPIVIKPINGCQGRGVSLNLTTNDQIRRAFQFASQYSSSVIVEQQLQGCDYRVLVVNGKVVAASERVPAHVRGDGRHTIAELIAIENQNPARGEDHDKALTKIKLDDVAIESLHKCGLSINDIPLPEERVFLRECANLSTGGTARDVTALIHPSILAMCERTARIINLDVCGIDLILDDIATPLQSRNGIVEVNAAPGLRMHVSPGEGQSRAVGQAIVETLYPNNAPSRIPIFSVTGTNGKTTIARMIAHLVGESGQTVGLTTTDGIYLGSKKIVSGDTTGPRSARTVLSDPSVEVAVLETARGGIVRNGLGYDWSDISIISNVRLDHIGQDGIETLEDLLYIKSLVAERVREGGTLILNADDERLAQLMELPRINRIKKNVVFFSMHPLHVTIRRHLDAGGCAFLLKNGWLVEATSHQEIPLIRASEIPVTLGGAASFHVANALAAAAAGRAYGLSPQAVTQALKTFRQSEGRAGLYAVAGGYVLVDYGHNPDAFTAIGRMAATYQGRLITGIIGVPGDRKDAVVIEAGQVIAQGFQKILIKEDHDLRGRQSRVIASLLQQTIKAAAPQADCRIVLDEIEALRLALREMTPGELIVIFYEKLAPILSVLEEFKAEPATSVPLFASGEETPDRNMTRLLRAAQA